MNVTEQCGTHGLDAPQCAHVRAVFVLLDGHVVENPVLDVGAHMDPFVFLQKVRDLLRVNVVLVGGPRGRCD